MYLNGYSVCLIYSAAHKQTQTVSQYTANNSIAHDVL